MTWNLWEKGLIVIEKSDKETPLLLNMNVFTEASSKKWGLASV
jgi:hypothetical protein